RGQEGGGGGRDARRDAEEGRRSARAEVRAGHVQVPARPVSGPHRLERRDGLPQSREERLTARSRPGDAAMATTPAVTSERGFAAEYARLEERILARDQIAASQVLYGLLKQGRPVTEIAVNQEPPAPEVHWPDAEPLPIEGALGERLNHWLTLVQRGEVLTSYRVFLGLMADAPNRRQVLAHLAFAGLIDVQDRMLHNRS